ncbi:unnamed protein product [Protopolystoma xenopodis]|uniref:Uncharacterized protein n=1 Tax=Protopolystoma xenopodis TaxID=117903 RepID=A0A3S5AUX8_9PLAT|nr:unnamed protein product [Protopolystoma xenopodis]
MRWASLNSVDRHTSRSLHSLSCPPPIGAISQTHSSSLPPPTFSVLVSDATEARFSHVAMSTALTRPHPLL